MGKDEKDESIKLFLNISMIVASILSVGAIITTIATTL